MANATYYSKQNAPAGFIRPDGTFVDLRLGSHSRDARRMGASLRTLLKKGWIRKAGQGAYEGNFTPVTLQAIEHDLIEDYGDLKMTGRFGASIDYIVLEHARTKTSIQIPLRAFEQAGFDLRSAIRKSRGADDGLKFSGRDGGFSE